MAKSIETRMREMLDLGRRSIEDSSIIEEHKVELKDSNWHLYRLMVRTAQSFGGQFWPTILADYAFAYKVWEIDTESKFPLISEGTLSNIADDIGKNQKLRGEHRKYIETNLPVYRDYMLRAIGSYPEVIGIQGDDLHSISDLFIYLPQLPIVERKSEIRLS